MSRSQLSAPVSGVFSQLLLVSLCVRRQMRPAFLILLRDTSVPVLTEVLRALRRRLGAQAAPPRHVVCSSGPELLAAAAVCWPDARIGCSVAQYCRDVLTRVRDETPGE